MNISQLLRMRLPGWADILTLGLMAVAAPWIAAFIQSLRVFYSDFRLYNAQIWGVFFDNMGNFIRVQPHQINVWITDLACRYAMLGLVTFLVLLPFRKLSSYCWGIWALFICLWMTAFSMAEVVLK